MPSQDEIWAAHVEGEEKYLRKPLVISQETAEELLLVLNHNYIPYEYTLVHAFIKRCWEFTGNK